MGPWMDPRLRGDDVKGRDISRPYPMFEGGNPSIPIEIPASAHPSFPRRRESILHDFMSQQLVLTKQKKGDSRATLFVVVLKSAGR